MSDETKLLPCPFCGGEARQDFETDGDYPDHCFMAVECRDCRAASRPVYGTRHPSEWAEAREAWNRRVPVQGPPSQPAGGHSK